MSGQAVTLLGNREMEEKRSIAAVQLPIYLTLSLTQLRLDRPLKALEYGHKAMEIDPTNTKALFHCGQVRSDPQGGGSHILVNKLGSCVCVPTVYVLVFGIIVCAMDIKYR